MQAVKVVLKFGGSSVAEVAHWQTIANQVQYHLDNDRRPLLVLSALKNVSNLLEALLHQALAGVHPVAITHLKELHLGFASQLGLELNQHLCPWFEQLEMDCLSIYQAKQISPKSHAKILAIGELLSTTIGSEFLKEQGFDVVWLDAREVLRSNDQLDPWHHYTSAECDYRHNPDALAHVNSESQCDSSIIVTQGFIASDIANGTVLLGREGSDTSAAYFAAILNAEQLEIWTDVTGVFSANPREISDARHLPELSYQQALLMARFGAKVLHPRVMQPMEENQIPVIVRSTVQPEHAGTLISNQSMSDVLVKAVVYELNITQLILPNFLAEERFKWISERLSGQGFDSLLAVKVKGDSHLLLKYSNSDKVQPGELELQNLLVEDGVLVKTHCTLITLIGESSEPHWTVEASKTVEKLLGKKIISVYPDENNSRLSFLVKSEYDQALSQQLHHEIIK